MTKLFAGRCAVVTGGGRGIGREVCLSMATLGANIVVNDIGGGSDTVSIDHGPADKVVEEITSLGGIAVPNYDTVTDFKAAQNIIETCIKSFGKIERN